ncbi:MAG: fibronectin type III domain-containing protein [Butyricicoccus sp.]
MKRSKRALSALLMAAMAASSLPMSALAAEPDSVYAYMNVPFEEFYASLNRSATAVDTTVDAVSSATTAKAAACSNVYFADVPAIEDGTTILGVTVPVKVSAQEFDENTMVAMAEAPDAYLEKNAAGIYEFKGVQKTINGVSAAITSKSTWGDYELDLTSSIGTGDTYISRTGEEMEAIGVLSAKVYGSYVTTAKGDQYAMKQSENLWAPSDYYEFGWSTAVQTEDIHGAPMQYEYYADMEGQTIESITYVTTDGIITCNLAEGQYVAPHHKGELAVVQNGPAALKVTVPSDLKNVTVSVATTGRGSVSIADNASIVNGQIALDTSAAVDGTAYTVSVSSSNYAVMTTTFTYSATAPEIVSLATPSIKTIANKQTGIQITWGAVKNATGYDIYRRTGLNSYKKIASVDGNTTSYLSKSLTNGTKYSYKVVATSTDSAYESSAKSAAKVMYRMTRPTISSAKNSASRKMTVKWSKNSKASSYQLQYRKKGSTSWTTVTTTSASKTVSKLTKNKTYEIRVRSYKKVGSSKYYSAWSSTKTVKISK